MMESRRSAKEILQTIEGEHFKTGAELAVRGLDKIGATRILRGGARLEDSRLAFEAGGLSFENPVMVGAGWDKKGWAFNGLYQLGFAGEEVGSVPLHPQTGNPRPRLFYDRRHHVALNRFGFNSPGALAVAEYLAERSESGTLGVSLTLNKDVPEEEAPTHVAEVAKIVEPNADYLVINYQSPNTKNLRDMMMRRLDDSIAEVQSISNLPLWIKLSVDMDEADVLTALEIGANRQVAGFIDSNTTIDELLKQRYGWGGQAGGLSGDDPDFRQRANERMKFITRESAGTDLARIGVGGIKDAETALQRIKAGAQVVQVVTAMRQTKLRAAQIINRGLLETIDSEGASNIQDFVGLETDL